VTLNKQGTYSHMAPEMIFNNQYNKFSDVYSFGGKTKYKI
jgi:hypothetical protein